MGLVELKAGVDILLTVIFNSSKENYARLKPGIFCTFPSKLGQILPYCSNWNNFLPIKIYVMKKSKSLGNCIHA
jgi:hypothetical protein